MLRSEAHPIVVFSVPANGEEASGTASLLRIHSAVRKIQPASPRKGAGEQNKTTRGSNHAVMRDKRNQKSALRSLTESGLIAALYAAATLALAPLSFGAVQVRAGEALTLLAILTPSGVGGITLGCFIANCVGVSMQQSLPIDIFAGTLASFLAALCTRAFRNTARIGGERGVSLLSVLSPVVFNALIVGGELTLFFGVGSFAFCVCSVALGELAAVCLLGIPLLLALRRTKLFEEGGE